MKLLFISDSHKNIDKILRLKEMYPNFLIYHAGDHELSLDILNEMDIVSVKGNCDKDGVKELVFNLGSHKVLLTHGDLYNVKWDFQRLFYKALELDANIVVFGHTHIPLIKEFEGITFLNPGSLKSDSTYIKYEDGQFTLLKLGGE